jgi:hypothetical protein
VKNEKLKFQVQFSQIRWANWFLIGTWILTQIFSFSNFSWRNWFNVHFGILYFLSIFCTTWIIKHESCFFFFFKLVMYITILVETIHEGKDDLAKFCWIIKVQGFLLFPPIFVRYVIIIHETKFSKKLGLKGQRRK